MASLGAGQWKWTLECSPQAEGVSKGSLSLMIGGQEVVAPGLEHWLFLIVLLQSVVRGRRIGVSPVSRDVANDTQGLWGMGEVGIIRNLHPFCHHRVLVTLEKGEGNS